MLPLALMEAIDQTSQFPIQRLGQLSNAHHIRF